MVRALANIGHDVISYDVKDWKFGKIDKIEPVYGNTLEGEHLKGQIRKVDMVFHLAAIPFIPDGYINPRKVVETDIIGTLNVLLALKEHKVPLLHFSSSEVYGGTIQNPINESHSTEPKSTYAAAKLGAERLVYTFCNENRIPYTILRQFNVIGPDDTHPRIVPLIISQLYNGSTVTVGNTNPSRDFTYVTDAVDACLKTIDNQKAINQTINIGTGRAISIWNLIQIISQKMIGKMADVAVDKARFRPLDVNLLCADNRKAKQLLGWQPQIGLNDALDKIISWRKNHLFEFESQ